MIVRNGRRLGSILHKDTRVLQDEPGPAPAKPKATRKAAPKANVKTDAKPKGVRR